MKTAEEEIAKDMAVGMRVKTAILGKGFIIFAGDVHFSRRKLIGVELDYAKGKHNGTVKRQRYFKTKKKHGAFVPPSSLKIIKEEVCIVEVSLLVVFLFAC